MNKINVIIAHKDYNEYLPDAIKSCLDQTIPVNYTVIDDGSDTPPEAPDWPVTKDNQNYRILSQDGNNFIFLKNNLGPSMARNIGILETIKEFDYFQILDADDIMLPNKCERLLAEMDDNTGIVYGDYYIESEGILKMEFKIPYTQIEFNQHCIVHSGSLISKKALLHTKENNLFYDPTLKTCEDYDLFLRISEFFMVKHVPEFLTTVKEHSFNSTNSVSKERWQTNLNHVFKKRLIRQNV